MDSAVSIQSQVKEYLNDTGRKKKWLAAQLEISPAVLSQWLMGKTTFSAKRLTEILNIIRTNE
jgi:DNA-binding transcriptional regulator YdaS (Cro superfamily)|nr:MAG TPA: Regulatory protein [Caudoviricetes sp.]